MNEMLLSEGGLTALVNDFLSKGFIVISESPDGTGYRAVKNGGEVHLDASRPPAAMTWKDMVFPRTEPVFHYRRNGDNVGVFEVTPEERTTVVLGAKPCDARSIAILDKLFNWDYHDDYFNVRARNTIVIGMACNAADEQCFCTSVGLSPVSAEGSDLFLVPLQGDSHAMRAVTPRGEQFIAQFARHTGEGVPELSNAALGGMRAPAPRFESDGVRTWLAAHFEDPFWKNVGDNCIGCSRCAFTCPVCHCFDLVDEEDSYTDGRRMKNWDACQAPIFTKHASGHNPRDNQDRRYRQRVMHKFRIYPERFGEILCTGCGRCTRGCPVGMDIAEVVTNISLLAQA